MEHQRRPGRWGAVALAAPAPGLLDINILITVGCSEFVGPQLAVGQHAVVSKPDGFGDEHVPAESCRRVL